MTTETKAAAATPATSGRRYRVPYVEADEEGEQISLDDFDTDDIREYLERVDNNTLTGPASDPRASVQDNKIEPLTISGDDLYRINILAVAGQSEPARAEALRIVSDHIGRPL